MRINFARNEWQSPLAQRASALQPKVARSRATLGLHRNMIVYPNGVVSGPFTQNDATPLG
jgi:hypothetical protein